MSAPQNHDETAAEKLFLEQGRAYYRDLRGAGENAPYDKGLQRAEELALNKGHELVRKSLELVAQENIEQLEKKKKIDNVNAAENAHTEDIPKNKPSPPLA